MDYAIINEHLYNHVNKFQVMEPSLGSDHCALKLEISIPKMVKKNNNNMIPHSPQMKWNNKTKEIFNHQINSNETLEKVVELENLVEIEGENNIDKVIEKLNIIYNQNIDKTGTKKAKLQKNKTKHKKWFDYQCYEMNKRLKLVAKLCATSPKNPHLRGSLIKTRKEYKKLLRYKKQEWKKQVISKLEKAETSNPQEYWKLVSELRERNRNTTNSNPEDFTSFFEKLYAKNIKYKNNTHTLEIEEIVQKTLNRSTDLSLEPDFKIEELRKAIHKLKSNKSAGPDRIPAEMLKASPEIILKLLVKIMNKIKSLEHYPLKWALGITSLIFKDGNDEDPNNYRAITVTDAMSKILAIMINERLNLWQSNNNILCEEQIGFKKKSRPSDHLFVLKNCIDKYLNQGKKIYTCFVDFQKAFDSVWRTGLYYKLIEYGMSLNLIKLIKNMYDKTNQSLKINNQRSCIFNTHKGVRRVYIKSPTL